MNSQTINADVTMSGEGRALLAGRYRVVRQLGQGGMGSVWLAEDTKLDGRQVAVKMLPSILINNRRAYAQVKQEALVSLRLSHPNIATLRAFEEDGNSPFLVIDYIDGMTLDDLLAERGGRLSEEEAVRILKPVAAALDYAHGEKVIHRDVKPGNVMIRTDGHPFILDFGIAREVQETMTRVTGRLSSGTLMYMSPEQLNGVAPSAAQDVYSFAAMAYECLSGQPPFFRGQVEHQILNNPPPPLPGDSQFVKAVMKALAKDPKDRPASCAAFFTPVATPALRPIAKPQVPIQPPRPAGAKQPVKPLSDAVYLLEAKATDALAKLERHEPYPLAPLEQLRQETLTSGRAARSALSRGDGEAAERLFSAILDFPKRLEAKAAELALTAFGAENWKDAFEALKEVPEPDDRLQFWLGYCYGTGAGVEKDLARSLSHYRKAAEAGNVTARFNLAQMLERGLGCERNLSEAFSWYVKVAEVGGVDAERRLGEMYEQGVGTEMDLARAFYWYRKAAKAGDPASQFRCCDMLENARGVEKDLAAAEDWCRRAVALGFKPASARLMHFDELRAKAEQEAAARAEAERAAREKAQREAAARRREIWARWRRRLPRIAVCLVAILVLAVGAYVSCQWVQQKEEAQCQAEALRHAEQAAKADREAEEARQRAEQAKSEREAEEARKRAEQDKAEREAEEARKRTEQAKAEREAAEEKRRKLAEEKRKEEKRIAEEEAKAKAREAERKLFDKCSFEFVFTNTLASTAHSTDTKPRLLVNGPDLKPDKVLGLPLYHGVSVESSGAQPTADGLTFTVFSDDPPLGGEIVFDFGPLGDNE